MLNIPDSVKALYKLDACRKNFRVHFPDGELPDVKNENIVQESVHFCESVSSRDVLKFGLTEASSIEFECVGVANMYGMTIECSSEIDCSSLSAAEIAEIEAGEWDGEYVPLADSDLGYAYFRVPYGVFRVESCPRDHQAMAHRKVTAYTQMMGTRPTSPQEVGRLSVEIPNNESYTASVEKTVLANLGYFSPDIVTACGYTKEAGKAFSTSTDRPGGQTDFSTTVVVEQRGNEGQELTLYYRYTCFERYIQDVSVAPTETVSISDLLSVEFNGYDISAFYDFVTWLDENYILKKVGGTSYPSGTKFSDVDTFRMAGWRITRVKRNTVNDSTNYVPIYSDVPCLWTYRGDSKNASDYYRTEFRLMQNCSLENSGGYVIKEAHENLSNLPLVRINKYAKSNGSPSIVYEATGSRKNRVTGRTEFSYTDSYDLQSLSQDYFEIISSFLSANRNGGYSLKRLDNYSPVSIAPNGYSQMWWDEYNVEPIGTIRYAYTDEAGEEQIVDYQFGDGASVYDMTDNAVLKAMSGASPDVIESLLDTSFIPHLGPVNFTPIDLNMKGLPYLEAGDALAFTAQDGTVCNSYALRQEIDGIQSLTAQIDSESGLIIDSEEGA